MKKLLVLLVFLLLAGGAGAGWYVYNDGQLLPPGPAPNAPPPPPKDPKYVTIGPVIVPVFGKETQEQTVVIVVSLLVDGPVSDVVTSQAPRLMDRYLSALYGTLQEGQMFKNNNLDMEYLKTRLDEATVKVLGPGLVYEVLVQGVDRKIDLPNSPVRAR